MVQGEVYVDASHMPHRLLREQQLWHPAADNHDVVAVLTQQVHKFEKDRLCRLNLVRGVVTKRYRYKGLMTSSRIAFAASSPCPFVCDRPVSPLTYAVTRR